MAVQVNRTNKSKKAHFTSFEIFRLSEKDVPVETVELTDTISHFSWEPTGPRFGILVSDGAATTKMTLYENDPKQTPAQFKPGLTYDRRNITRIVWSPAGRFAVLSGLDNVSGILEFWDMSSMDILTTTDHYLASDIEWSPCGRFLTTAVSHWKHKMENGFVLWDFRGTPLRRHPVAQHKQLLWRPRPPTLLSDAARRDIRKRLRTYAAAFDAHDARATHHVSQQVQNRRAKQRHDWAAWQATWQRRYDAARRARRAARPAHHLASDDEGATEEVAVWVDTVLSETTELAEA